MNQLEIRDFSVDFLSIVSRFEKDGDVRKSFVQLSSFFREYINELSAQSTIHLPTLFSKIYFLSTQLDLERKQVYLLHHFRKGSHEFYDKNYEEEAAIELLGHGIFSLATLIVKDPNILQKNQYEKVIEQYRSHIHLPKTTQGTFKQEVKAEIINHFEEEKYFEIIDHDVPHKSFKLLYDGIRAYEPFLEELHKLLKFQALPISINMVNVNIQKDDSYHPEMIVIEPDYLIDVSAIAETFNAEGAAPFLYIIKKFSPFQFSVPILRGHIANFFLDELIQNPSVEFDEIFKQVFVLNPMGFALMEDEDLIKLKKDLRLHFSNLAQMVKHQLSDIKVHRNFCLIEPSFYAPRFGIQGRLDLFHVNNANLDIIELKSGKPFRTNAYGLNANHYIQTLLYHLIVQSVFGKKQKISSYILYSSQSDRTLRIAPPVKALNNDAIKNRNRIIIFEKLLSGSSERMPLLKKLFDQLATRNFPDLKGFHAEHIQKFEKAYTQSSELEQKYFMHFVRFNANEHRLAKVGEQGNARVNGLASLWLNDLQEKEESFSLFAFLNLSKKEIVDGFIHLSFLKTKKTSKLSNFRIGDIAVLYPFRHGNESVKRNQIFKATIIAMTGVEIVLRLRNKQVNLSYFKESWNWNIEHDVLDSSFNVSYYNLVNFLSYPKRVKNLILSKNAPTQLDERSHDYQHQELTSEQAIVLNNMIAAKDYFLLWGPPGTGKTSIMIKHFVRHLYANTQETILLTAFTNKAVDEICFALELLREEMSLEYIRVGSSYATNEKFKPYLLRERIENIKSRSELKQMLDQHRIVVGTVSSIGGKKELFELKKFDTMIIDEASQILETQILGLLNHCKRWVMVGDHKQLPAVVVQSDRLSKTNDPILQHIGLFDMRNSLFERLIKTAQNKSWTWAFDQLSHQGRMHSTLMDFPNQYFYQNKLKALDFVNQRPDFLFGKMLTDYSYEYSDQLGSERLLFIDTKVEEEYNQKINTDEASHVVKIIKYYMEVCAQFDIQLKSDAIGVICPYKAQIAKINEMLNASNVDHSKISIDTVERYQGGARNIIIYSLCVNRVRQIPRLMSLSDEGVDRKLNVALTRAKEQIIILGNKEILKSQSLFKSLVQHHS